MGKARMDPNGDDAWTAAAMGTAPARPAAPAPAPRVRKSANKQAGMHANTPAPAPRGKQVPDGLVPFSTYLPPELRRRVKVHAAEVGRPVWQVVADALEAHLPRR